MFNVSPIELIVVALALVILVGGIIGVIVLIRRLAAPRPGPPRQHPEPPPAWTQDRPE